MLDNFVSFPHILDANTSFMHARTLRVVYDFSLYFKNRNNRFKHPPCSGEKKSVFRILKIFAGTSRNIVRIFFSNGGFEDITNTENPGESRRAAVSLAFCIVPKFSQSPNINDRAWPAIWSSSVSHGFSCFSSVMLLSSLSVSLSLSSLSLKSPSSCAVLIYIITQMKIGLWDK